MIYEDIAVVAISKDGAASRVIEKDAGLRRPEISLAVKELKEQYLISELKDKKPCKERPYKIYSLKLDSMRLSSSLKKNKRSGREIAGKSKRRQIPEQLSLDWYAPRSQGCLLPVIIWLLDRYTDDDAGVEF